VKQTHVFKNLLHETVSQGKFLTINEVDANSHQKCANNMFFRSKLLQIWKKAWTPKYLVVTEGLPITNH